MIEGQSCLRGREAVLITPYSYHLRLAHPLT